MDNQKKIVFENSEDKDLNKIIFEILKNNAIKETPDDYIEKASSGKDTLADIIYDLAEDLANGSINEENFILLTQKQLQVPRQNAENILKEIKGRLLPLARTLTEDEIESEEKYINNKIIQPLKQINPVVEEEVKNKVMPPPKRIKKLITPTIEETKESTPKPIQKSGPDNYREPIE